MDINIEIHYIASGSKSSQQASFQQKGRRPEKIALEWWRHIKREMSYHAELVRVIANGTQDITQVVKDLEEQKWNNRLNEDLPF